MQGVFSKIYLVSLLILSGCANNQLQPSLSEHVSYRISQVSTEQNTNPGLLREHPYFIVCEDPLCPSITEKTPIQYVAFNSSVKTTKTDIEQDSSLATEVHKGQLITGKNTTYLNKTPTLLEQFRVNFDYASASISNTYKNLLKSFVKDFQHGFRPIRITGFTDNSSYPRGQIGNEWLALERATSVKNYLIALGYPESQVLLEAKFLCCYIDSNENEEGRKNNRRAEISLLNFK